MSNDCLRSVSRRCKQWAYHDWRCGFSLLAIEPLCLPAGGTLEQDTDLALCPDQYSRCVLGCHFRSYRQPGTRFVLPAVKILLTGAASESTAVSEPVTPGNHSIPRHDRVYLYKWK